MPVFPDALITALLGYGVVFVGLVLLMAVIVVMGKAMTVKEAAPAPVVPQSQAPIPPSQAPGAVPLPAKTAPGSAGQITLNGVEDRDAAMIMAIVADTLGKPLNELRFKSIKEVK